MVEHAWRVVPCVEPQASRCSRLIWPREQRLGRMKAVVLVGGEGSRLRPLTYTTPKPLLPIVNQPFLERQLVWLSDHGVDEVVLSMGYLPDAFHAHFRDESGNDSFRGMRLHYAVENEPLGTAGAIRFAAAGIDERFVVCNGDVLTGLDLSAMVEFHDERKAEVTIALTQVEDPSAFGVVPTAADGGVIAFVEKPAPGSAPSDWINAGTYVLEPSFLERIPPRLNVSVERETFPRLLEHPGPSVRVPYRRVLARHRNAGEVPRGAHRRVARLRRPAADARRARAVRRDLDPGRRDDRARRDGARADAARPGLARCTRAHGCAARCSVPGRSSSPVRCSRSRCCTKRRGSRTTARSTTR